jgi:hypothetical protein
MKLLDWLEKRLSPLAIPNLTLMLIIGQAVIYLASQPQVMAGQGAPLLENIALVPSKVFEGEVWRIVTYLFDPPATNVLFAFFFWYLFYLMGTALEQTWGAFRYNMFILVGYVASVAAVLLLPEAHNVPASNFYLYGSVFLAFARFFPDFVINLFLILPIKIKWLALIAWIGYALRFVGGSNMDRVLVVAALANYVLFFWRDHLTQMKDHRRRLDYATKTTSTAKKSRLVHTCAVCGRSSADEPRTAFRYCSQCDGQMCYCPDHIRDHEHVVEQHASG